MRRLRISLMVAGILCVACGDDSRDDKDSAATMSGSGESSTVGDDETSAESGSSGSTSATSTTDGTSTDESSADGTTTNTTSSDTTTETTDGEACCGGQVDECGQGFVPNGGCDQNDMDMQCCDGNGGIWICLCSRSIHPDPSGDGPSCTWMSDVCPG
jgi:hypothetical protein